MLLCFYARTKQTSPANQTAWGTLWLLSPPRKRIGGPCNLVLQPFSRRTLRKPRRSAVYPPTAIPHNRKGIQPSRMTVCCHPAAAGRLQNCIARRFSPCWGGSWWIANQTRVQGKISKGFWIWSAQDWKETGRIYIEIFLRTRRQNA